MENIRNPLNEDKPIKISRDGQELPANLGQQVTRLFDSGCQSAGVEPPPKAGRFPLDTLQSLTDSHTEYTNEHKILPYMRWTETVDDLLIVSIRKANQLRSS